MSALNTTNTERTTNVTNTVGAQTSAYRTDLVTRARCQYLGTGTDHDESIFDIYYDPDTKMVFKVISDYSCDTVIYAPSAE